MARAMRKSVTLLLTFAALSGPLAAAKPHANAQQKLLYWGDTHLHTSKSFDVFLFNTPASTPETAYRYARGEKVKSPTRGEDWQLSNPLDFLVVADHAELVGSLAKVYHGEEGYADLHGGSKRQAAWHDHADTAERFNEPGKFTALIGREWTAQPGGGILHRVTFTPPRETGRPLTIRERAYTSPIWVSAKS